MRRIALEKLFAHLTGMAIVVVVLALCGIVTGAAFNTLPGDEISVGAAVGFAAWLGVVGLASGSVAFALAPVLGRGGSAAIAGAVLLFGYFVNGYQGAVPGLRAGRQPDLVRLDGALPAAHRPVGLAAAPARARWSRSCCSWSASSCSRAATSA